VVNDRRTLTPVTARQVAQAREMQRKGYRLAQIAGILNVMSADLDRALWKFVDVDVEKELGQTGRPAPMF
jgi:hypothetical protein